MKIDPCPCGLTIRPVDVYVQVIPPVTEYNFVYCPNCQRKGPLRKDETDAIAGWNNLIKKEMAIYMMFVGGLAYAEAACNDPRRPDGPSAGHAFANAARKWRESSETEQQGEKS